MDNGAHVWIILEENLEALMLNNNDIESV